MSSIFANHRNGVCQPATAQLAYVASSNRSIAANNNVAYIAGAISQPAGVAAPS